MEIINFRRSIFNKQIKNTDYLFIVQFLNVIFFDIIKDLLCNVNNLMVIKFKYFYYMFIHKHKCLIKYFIKMHI